MNEISSNVDAWGRVNSSKGFYRDITQTHSLYSCSEIDANGDESIVYTDERAKYHQKYQNSVLERIGIETPNNSPVLILMLGGPGSGKSSSPARDMAIKELKRRGYIAAGTGAEIGIAEIDPDEAAHALPELADTNDPDRRVRVIDEARYMCDSLLEQLLDEGKSCAFQTSGVFVDQVGSYASLARDHGYKVVVVNFTVDPNEAIYRDYERHKLKAGNRPPIGIKSVLIRHQMNASIWEDIIPLVDCALLYDNNGEKPVFVADGTTILDANAYKDFQDKALINVEATKPNEVYAEWVKQDVESDTENLSVMASNLSQIAQARMPGFIKKAI